MKSSIFPVLLVVVGGVLYHIAQKSIPRSFSPLAVVIVAYAAGIVLCAIGLCFDPAERSWWASLKQVNWAVISIGIGAVLIELGFMLTYRAGWDLSVASVFSNIAIALALLPFGFFFFREHLTARTVAGIGCCLVGMILLAKK